VSGVGNGATVGEGESFRLSVERIIVCVTMQVGAMPVQCCGRERFQQGGVLCLCTIRAASRDADTAALLCHHGRLRLFSVV
jgi:hypothetical protein